MSSTTSTARRPMRRSGNNRRKTTGLNVDLNSLPVEAAGEGLPVIESPPPPPPQQPDDAGTVIDVEAIDDDEVQLLSAPRVFPQTRNQARRRNRPVVVLVDEDRDNYCLGNSGASVNSPVALPHLNRRNKQQMIPPNITVVNCEQYSISGDNYSAKRKKASVPVPEKVVQKEPTFSCPICMSAIVNACSTICGHIFCETCIKTSLSVQKQCPTCRKKLTPKNIHKVYFPNATTD